MNRPTWWPDRSRPDADRSVDLARPPSAARDEQWTVTLVTRYIGLVVLAMAALALPNLGPERKQIAVLLLVVGLPYNAVIHLMARRRRQPPWFMPFTDQLGAFAVLTVEPRVVVPAVLVMLTGIAVTAVAFGRRQALMTSVMAASGLAILTITGRIDTDGIVILAWGISAATVSVSVGSLAENERAVREEFSDLVEGVDGVVWEVDARTLEARYVSPAITAMVGYPPEHWGDARTWINYVHPKDRDRTLHAFGTAITQATGVDVEYRVQTADGRWVRLHNRLSVSCDTSGNAVTLRGLTTDVTEQRETEERVRQYADIVERIQVALMILRPDDPDDPSSLRFVAANPAATHATEVPVEQMVGARLDEVLPQLLVSPLPSLLWEVLQTGEAYDHGNLLLGREERRVFSIHAFPLPGRAVGVALDDVTHASLATDALRRQALHDELTGLPNRAMLKTRLRDALDPARGLGRPIALFMLDLDQFKEVNDALGHHHGDLLLIELARRLQGVLPDCDLVARLGGDEFAIVYSERVTAERAVAVAERIGRALQEPFQIEDLALQTNASIGIALYPEHARDADALTQRADVAMYMAKRAGKGFAVYTPDQDRSSVRRLTLLGELRRGLDLEEFTLYYQPVLELQSGLAVRAEALIRWNHPEHGLMSPGEFIPLAEVSGVIQPMTRWVMRSAIEAAAGWHEQGLHLGVAVNLSVRNLYDPGLPGHLRSLLAEGVVAPDDLTLEITESELMEDPSLAREVLEQLRDLGVATAIDDFGTGYSSLSYLKDLPISQIKIDRSFVSGMRTRAEDLAIVRSMIELGHNMGLEVVAEGIGDGETLDRLAEMGCDLGQGYLVSPPLTGDDLRTWVLHHQGTELAGPGLGAPGLAGPSFVAGEDLRTI